MIGFRVVPHSILPGVQIVEVLVDGEVGGVVYPAGEKAIRIVSAHIAETATDEGFDGEVVEDDGTKSDPPIPTVYVRFDPSPYEIRGSRIVKLRRH
ncbi:MAG: hypothetical protein A3A43_02010 [Candidatus Liptonbacteria bacterium RIFCSPLOWO2_01_FULL_56_20]|uniref:Uncharacterized protein n=1 Tax=Candidatus Liptonbacteria bacterium RIFCSPLOWO2_01_FULL_56_20 TaxID=1798652 RepID=A0A1G2CJ28_9BACT|nr:MAG: hypothetical protein A2681_00820 [Candidatus Liptonbacteria bacterium RIFCSPHIGHO2_01_FULL_56_18b]OGZ00661.1 MAG: hypothetical protein A3A43_02010 [Candidatus Liptonbacteria bacterium RIFCSPLOWO2_01_FULL_56_20]